MITLAQFNAMKRQATRLKKQADGITHTQALDSIAREYGYSSWAYLARTVQSPPRDEKRA